VNEVLCEIRGSAGFITLNRPQALNALSLAMIRELTAALLAWRDDPRVERVAVRGMGRDGPFGAFCAGGDIRFFHQAVLAGDPRLEDFFTEEYTLNHLIHGYPKPYMVFLDGVVMGGGMGISAHGSDGSLRIATERTRMAMPETQIGLFPDVGGGWFLARCPGRIGEYLALTGHRADIDRFFAHPGVIAIVQALEADAFPWARETAALLRKRSPLMLHVTLEHLRRARHRTLAADLRMERDMVRHCFHLRPGAASETFEGIRALAIDKDHAPRWNPARIEDVTPAMVEAFFAGPWPAHAHPLRALA